MPRTCEDCMKEQQPGEDFNQAFEGNGTEIWLCDDCLKNHLDEIDIEDQEG